MKSIRSIAALSGAILLLGSGFQSPASAAEITLKLGTVSNQKTSMGKALANVLIPKIKEYSGGRMEIQAHWMGSICGEQRWRAQRTRPLIATGGPV